MLKFFAIIMGFWVVWITPVWAHQDVWLRNEQGDRITARLNSIDPYSPKKTCGVCHNYAVITSGYHFQQGFDVMKDGYDARKPWILSPGMFGNWLPTAAAASLAPKAENSALRMDLSTYDWIGAGKHSPKHKVKSPSCGSCHPGGGPLEYGRDSRGRANNNQTHIQAEAAGSTARDGDYSSRFTLDGKSAFRQSGGVEADCLICHLPGYRMDDRNEQLYRRNYRWAATAGAGLGAVKGAVFTYRNPAAGPEDPDFAAGTWNLSKRPIVTYNWSDRRFFATDGRMKGTLIRKNVQSRNCLQCHAEGEAKNTGTAFDSANDVHIKAGMNCVDCHPLAGGTKDRRLAHQIAKGKSLTNRVRDDLDGVGMRTCQSCHSQGNHRGPREAKNPIDTHAQVFAGAVFHTYIVSCASCHITEQPLSALTVLDMSTGQEYGYTADRFSGVAWPGDYLLPASKPWAPWQTRSKKYLATVPKHLQWFGEKRGNGEIRPIPMHQVARASRSIKDLTRLNVTLPDGRKVSRRTVVSDADIRQMLSALGKIGFRNVCYVSDQVYELKGGKLTSSSALSGQRALHYAVEHGVRAVAGQTVYGRKGKPDGCMQCHDDASSFFSKMDIDNLRGFLQKDYPVLKEPNAVPQYELWGLRSVPSFE